MLSLACANHPVLITTNLQSSNMGRLCMVAADTAARDCLLGKESRVDLLMLSVAVFSALTQTLVNHKLRKSSN